MNFDTSTHNGCITITNPVTGQHRTFRIRTQKDAANFCPGKRIVSILEGPDNESDYRGFGFVKDDGRIILWRKKRTSFFEKVARMLEDPKWFMARGIEYDIEGRCRKCNRKLTVSESIRSGIGPTCAKQSSANAA